MEMGGDNDNNDDDDDDDNCINEITQQIYVA